MTTLKTAPLSFIQAATVRLNVGGQTYTVSCSLIKLYPDSMLARLVSKEWNNEEDEANDDSNNSDNVIFIDRDGHRFRYVLDFMRDQEISLPLTESLQAIKRELAYFGLWLGDNDDKGDDLSSKITIGTPAEAGEMMASIGGNMNEELDELDKDIVNLNQKIQERKFQKSVVIIAKSLFERSVAQHGSSLKSGDSFSINITRAEEIGFLRHSMKWEVTDFFKDKLASYGLSLVSNPKIDYPSYNDPVDVELKSSS